MTVDLRVNFYKIKVRENWSICDKFSKVTHTCPITTNVLTGSSRETHLLKMYTFVVSHVIHPCWKHITGPKSAKETLFTQLDGQLSD